jgi:hypothetical protein
MMPMHFRVSTNEFAISKLAEHILLMTVIFWDIISSLSSNGSRKVEYITYNISVMLSLLIWSAVYLHGEMWKVEGIRWSSWTILGLTARKVFLLKECSPGYITRCIHWISLPAISISSAPSIPGFKNIMRWHSRTSNWTWTLFLAQFSLRIVGGV